tara:strand:- start:319 stop:465 length:147 start_codon:yes stop_codon:yes gene_type:complete
MTVTVQSVGLITEKVFRPGKGDLVFKAGPKNRHTIDTEADQIYKLETP